MRVTVTVHRGRLCAHIHDKLFTIAFPGYMMDDVTGDRDWDSVTLLERILTSSKLCAQLLPEIPMPPSECIELGAGTGRMACALAERWPNVRYLATDLPLRVNDIAARANIKKLQDRLHAQPLIWGETPPSPTLSKGTYLVLLADLIYFAGKDLLDRTPWNHSPRRSIQFFSIRTPWPYLPTASATRNAKSTFVRSARREG